MFKFDVTNELMCIARGSGKFFAKKGAMVAFKGNFNFEKLLLGPSNGGGLGRALLGHVQRSLTGEQMPIMGVEGEGEIYLAQNAYHVDVISIDPGDSIYVESENLLAFSEQLNYSVKLIGSGVISQKGLFTTHLVNKTGQNQDVAIITDGNPLILEGPCCVDPDALVAWTGREPYPKVSKLSWKTFIGQTSGESYHMEFVEPGQIVIIQPSERLSGLKTDSTPSDRMSSGGLRLGID
ncbi:AIM24 family protein [Clostridioides difficile]|uniref:AIM24 family protein n=1 Tax=Clostridioides difficile TaxID=1496 RepID=UPI00038D2BDA|nr:AIM24 family protein [Clostridioides difficile]EQG11501.1 mitochondria biogenesis AIM24 family protein [Clostridioides difficile 6042]